MEDEKEMMMMMMMTKNCICNLTPFDQDDFSLSLHACSELTYLFLGREDSNRDHLVYANGSGS